MMHDDRTPPLDEQTAFERLASLSLSQESLDSVLQTVADLTKRVLPGDIEASVSVLLADRPATVVYTGQLALDLDESQYEAGYGPCLHAARTGETVDVSDTRTERRWREYMREAAERGALSSLSIPLGSPEQLAAGLNVYARQADAFDGPSRSAANRFARFAGAAAANMHAYASARELSDNLQAALESRATIDQAKGILMERHRLTSEQAFQLLAQASMATNTKLRDVADHLVATGELLAPRSRSRPRPRR
jgi:GAF domain-containing protein